MQTISKESVQEVLDQEMLKHPEFEAKLKFGSKGYETKGNMVAGVYQKMLVLNLGKERVDEFLQEPSTRKMDIIGRVLEDWIILEEGFYKDSERTIKLIEEAVVRVKALPRKH